MPQAALPWLAALVLLAATLFAPQVLNDGDTFSHVATGAWIIAHRAVPYADPFSHSMNGAPWVAHEWLAQVMLALAHVAAGWAGVVALTAGAAGAAFFMLARLLLRFMPAGVAGLLLLLAAAGVAPGMLARPHILAMPLLVAWAGGLVVARAEGRAPSWGLLAVMVVWANMHGGYMLGLLLAVPLALEAGRDGAASWGRFIAAAVVAAMMTPYGVAGLLFPFELALMPELGGIGEWRATDFSRMQPLELMLLVALYVALSRGARLPPLRLALGLGLLHMALQHTRHQALVGLLVPLLIAEPLGRALAGGARRAGSSTVSAIGVALCMGLVIARLAMPIALRDGPTAPVSAVRTLPSDLAGRAVLNDYGFGGYLIFERIPPFIDGRADMYGPGMLRRYAALSRPSRAALEDTLRTYRIGWTLLAPNNAAVELLDLMPGWCRRYADPVAIIHAPCG